jgi:hypothetical protein
VLARALGSNTASDEPQIAGHRLRQAATGEQSAGIGQVSQAVRRAARKLPGATGGGSCQSAMLNVPLNGYWGVR